MATTVQAVAEVRVHARFTSRWLAGWHLLSLDAPTVAAVWTWFIARACGTALPWQSVAAMFNAVWVLYAADRLLDARGTIGLEARHLFHRQHQASFRWGIAAGCAVLAILVPRMITAAVRLDLVLGALLVAWFVVIHSGQRPLPKEFVVGIFFAAAVFVPTIARQPDLRGELIVPAVLFAALCCLNCLFIFAWEHEDPDGTVVHGFTVLASRWAIWLAAALAVLCLAARGGPMLHAIALSAGLLMGAHTLRHQIERTTLRAVADLALLTPLLLAGWHG